MDSSSAQLINVLNPETGVSFFDPNFLNLEYFFNLILVFLRWLLTVGGLLGEGAFIDKAFLQNMFLIFSAIFILAIWYVFLQLRKLRKEEERRYGEIHLSALESVGSAERNYKWKEILNRIDSFNEADWRVAIIGADTMLDEMLEKMGYHGETIGDRLKAIEESDFLTLDKAWEAHKVRNRIAHEGTFVLTKREARRVIDLYREVFEEFHYI